MLLLHGLYGSPETMQYVGRKLKSAGFVTAAPTIRGCGALDATRPERHLAWETWLEQVEEHFETLKTQYESVSVAGLCAGADLALALATRRSADMHSLCLYSTTLFYDGWNVTRLRFLRALGYYTPLRHLLYFRERPPYGIKDDRVRQWIAAQMKRGGQIVTGAPKSSLLGIYQTERMMRYLRPRLSTVTVPSLIIHAREDDTTSLRSANWVEQHVGASLIRKVILENSYHNITLDYERDRVVRETIEFICRDTQPRERHASDV